ncbi:MAG: hypothetical protein SOW84_08945 [Candidatus Faecousia sp.]|nr:hypothetical protein [Candidatus Faecousia sp.]
MNKKVQSPKYRKNEKGSTSYPVKRVGCASCFLRFDRFFEEEKRIFFPKERTPMGDWKNTTDWIAPARRYGKRAGKRKFL